MNDEDFCEGNIDTSFIARKLKKLKSHNLEEAENDCCRYTWT
jgi:hypothetical protein